MLFKNTDALGKDFFIATTTGKEKKRKRATQFSLLFAYSSKNKKGKSAEYTDQRKRRVLS